MTAEQGHHDQPDGGQDRQAQLDQREVIMAQGEAQLDALEQRLDERTRSAGLIVAPIQERVHEAIQRGRARLAASAARLDRSEAALDRARARNHRQQEEIQRATAASERQHNQVAAPPTGAPDPTPATERLVALRQQLADAARKLATAEDETARLHEEIAVQRPDRALASRHIAEEARAAAQRVREIADNLSPTR